MKDLNSRDYDVNEIDEDRRFVNARKETLFAQIFFSAAIFAVIGVAFIAGNQNPRDMTYFFAWPAWYVAGVVTALIAIVIGLVWLKKGFKMDSLGALDDDKGAAK